MAGQTIADVFVQIRGDAKRLRPDVERAATEAGRAGGETLGDGLVRGADGKLRDAQGKFVASGRKSGDSFGKGFGSSDVFSTVAKIMASRFALMGGAAAAAAPGLIQFVGALAPAAGIVAGLPAVLGAGVVALGTFKAATAGVSDAVSKGLYGTTKAYNKALEDLPPAAQAATKSLVAMKPVIQDIRQAASERFFLPLIDDVRPLAQVYLPLAKTGMADLAGSMGGFAEQILQTGKSSVVVQALKDSFRQTHLAVVQARKGVDPLGKGIAEMVTATSPLISGMGAGFAMVGKRVGEWLTEMARSGAAMEVFREAQVTLGKLGGIAKNVGSILGSVFGAGQQAGGDLLGTLKDLTGQAASFLKSAEGSGALLSVFETMNKFGDALKKSLGAVLPEIAASVKVLAPALAGLAAPLADILVALAPLLTVAASLAAELLTRLTPAITALAGWMSRNADVVKVLAAALAGLFIAFKSIAAVQAAGGLAAWIAKAVLGTTVTAGLTGATTAFGVALKIAMGPIGLIVIGIAAIVTAIVLLWKKNEDFRNFILAAWDAIKDAVASVVSWFQTTAMPILTKVWEKIGQGAKFMWENFIKPAVDTLIQIFKTIVAPLVTWLWQNVFKPAFEGIGGVVVAMWAIVKPLLEALWFIIKNVIAPVVVWLWNNIVGPAFVAMGVIVKTWWGLVQGVLTLVVAFVKNVLAPVFTWLWHNIFEPVWNGIKNTVDTVWGKIKPIFEAFGNFIKDKVAPAFQSGVDTVKKAWDTIEGIAKVPIKFVVTSVINPLIDGFNAVSGVFNIPKVDTIKLKFKEGGRIPGDAGGIDDRQALVRRPDGTKFGPIEVGSGEFIVNAHDTARALPLLRWINNGMKQGPIEAARRIGRPLTDKPGDGSEGWAFEDGGVVDFFDKLGGGVGKIWGSIDSVWGSFAGFPGALVKNALNALGRVPGAGLLRDVTVGMGKAVAKGVVDMLLGGTDTSFASGVPGNSYDALTKAKTFVRAQAGKPYVWASAGPGGYDCSGIVSAAFNIMKGKNPYSHTFSTESLPGSFFPKGGPGGLLTAGWSHPGQRGASAGTGHMAGQLFGGLNFESNGSQGVVVGPGAAKVTSFAHVGHFAGGGLVPLANIARADFGSVTLQRGFNLIENATGQPEPLSRGGMSGGSVEQLLRELIGVMASVGPDFARHIGATTPGLLREARRR